MKKLFKISFYSYSLFTIVITIGCFNGYISFGHGLGDLYYLIFIFLILFISTAILFLKESNIKGINSQNVFGLFLV